MQWWKYDRLSNLCVIFWLHCGIQKPNSVYVWTISVIATGYRSKEDMRKSQPRDNANSEAAFLLSIALHSLLSTCWELTRNDVYLHLFYIYICEFGLSNAISWSLFLTWWMAPNPTVGKPKPRDISNRSIWVAIKTYNVHFVTLANQSQSLVRVNQTQISNYNFHTHTYIEINKFKIIPTTPIMNLPYFS